MVESRVPFRTETCQKTVLLSTDGVALEVTDEQVESIAAPGEPIGKDNDKATGNREFWQNVIASVRFEHPDQPDLRLGGNNWSRAKLPAPFNRLSAYRYVKGEVIGVWISIEGKDYQKGRAFFEEHLEQLRDSIDKELILFDKPEDQKVGVTLRLKVDVEDEKTLAMQTEWFCEHLNRFVNAIRPLAREFESPHSPQNQL